MALILLSYLILPLYSNIATLHILRISVCILATRKIAFETYFEIYFVHKYKFVNPIVLFC